MKTSIRNSGCPALVHWCAALALCDCGVVLDALLTRLGAVRYFDTWSDLFRAPAFAAARNGGR